LELAASLFGGRLFLLDRPASFLFIGHFRKESFPLLLTIPPHRAGVSFKIVPSFGQIIITQVNGGVVEKGQFVHGLDFASNLQSLAKRIKKAWLQQIALILKSHRTSRKITSYEDETIYLERLSIAHSLPPNAEGPMYDLRE